MTGSQPLHYITPIRLDDTFLELYVRTNDLISVVNAIHMYDIKATGGILHKRRVTGVDYLGEPTAVEVLELNFAKTGGSGQYGYGLGIQNIDSPNVAAAEGATFALRLDYNSLQTGSAFLGASGGSAYVHEYDLVSVAATGSRGDGAYRPLKVYAKDSLPYQIDGDHRFLGKVYFDGSEVVVNAAQLHIDDNLLFIASAGNTDNPGVTSGLSNNATLGGGSGSGIVIKGASGDKSLVYRRSDGLGNYYSFYHSEHIEMEPSKGFVSAGGNFKFLGISGSAPSISLRTVGQDSDTLPLGWKLYQSVTGDSLGTLKIKREGVTDFDALELFPTSEVKIGTIYAGTGGDGSFKTQAAKFSVPATREKGVLHHSWQNRDVLEIKATADGGMFSEPKSVFKAGTVLTFNDLGHYKRARWDADPSTGYKDAEVVGIIEKITSDDYVLQIPVQGASYTTSMFSLNENVSIVGNGKTIYGYVYENLPASGLSGIKVFVDSFPTGVTAGWFSSGGSLFVGGATLRGSADNDLVGICGSIGITLSTIDYAVIVRQGVFELPEVGQGATGYDASVGLSAGWLFYLGGTFGGSHTNAYGGVTYAANNLFDPEAFYLAGANVAKPLFIYLGQVDGKRLGLFQHYQGLGLTYSVTSYNYQPVYYNVDTGELSDFNVLGDVGGRNKILNSGFDLWTRLDAFGSTYEGFDGGVAKGITFNQTQKADYPFGSTYSDGTQTGLLRAGYITDSYFFDTYTSSRQLYVERTGVSGSFPAINSIPNYELKITQKGGSGKTRLYAVIPDHKTISDSDMNFSFYAKADAPVGITIGIGFAWGSGTTYAKIENYHAFITTDGTAGTGGAFDRYTSVIGTSYARYSYAFSSESLEYPGAGVNNSLAAPFIEIGSMSTDDSIHITGVQLTKGISPKPYEKRPVALEKAECDRFFQNVVVANGGYYPIFTGSSGPSIFTAANLQTPLIVVPEVLKASDVLLEGVMGASAFGDPHNIRRNSISLFRDTDTTSSTYHRYFETVYSLDASGFSGTVASRLTGLA